MYSVENPIAGATMAYTGRNAMVKTKDPGIAEERISQRNSRDDPTAYQPRCISSTSWRSASIDIVSLGENQHDVLGDQGSLAKHSEENGQVQSRPPEPMSGVEPCGLLEVSPEQDDRETEQNLLEYEYILEVKQLCRTYNTVIQRVPDPQPELRSCEERIALAEHVQLGIPVEDASGDELVEDTDDKRGENGEDDIVQGECPRLVGNLPREVVEERELKRVLRRHHIMEGQVSYPELCHVQHNVLVEGVWDEDASTRAQRERRRKQRT